jgi:predicted ATP-binding protein involved in virulence
MANLTTTEAERVCKRAVKLGIISEENDFTQKFERTITETAERMDDSKVDILSGAEITVMEYLRSIINAHTSREYVHRLAFLVIAVLNARSKRLGNGPVL